MARREFCLVGGGRLNGEGVLCGRAQRDDLLGGKRVGGWMAVRVAGGKLLFTS